VKLKSLAVVDFFVFDHFEGTEVQQTLKKQRRHLGRVVVGFQQLVATFYPRSLRRFVVNSDKVHAEF